MNNKITCYASIIVKLSKTTCIYLVDNKLIRFCVLHSLPATIDIEIQFLNCRGQLQCSSIDHKQRRFSFLCVYFLFLFDQWLPSQKEADKFKVRNVMG